MSKKASHLVEKYEAIRADFKVLREEGYRSEKIYKKLGKKYFMSAVTVVDIVWKNGVYADNPKPRKVDKKQMTIFDVIPTENDHDQAGAESV